MEAARELVVELGDHDKLSVRAVTARAGVSANALYLHFADREALLTAVILDGYRELRATLLAAVSQHADPIDQLNALGLAYIDFAAQRPGIYRVLFMAKVREGVPMPGPDVPSGADEGVDTFNDLRAIVERCLSDRTQAFARATYFWIGLHGYAAFKQALDAFPWPSPTEYVARLIQIHILVPAHSHRTRDELTLERGPSQVRAADSATRHNGGEDDGEVAR